MENHEAVGFPGNGDGDMSGQQVAAPSLESNRQTSCSSQAGRSGCDCGCTGDRCTGLGARDPHESGEAASFVYALGRVQPRFPTLALEKEVAQVTGRAETAGLTDPQALHAVLSQRQNRYLARQFCWVLTIEGMETYILQPRDPGDFELLVDTVRPNPSPMDMDVVIGLRGPIAPPNLCNGLSVPIVVLDQVYTFDREALLESIPRPEGMRQQQQTQFKAAAEELFDRVMQMADNAGATDEHRALNYLLMRYPVIYATTAERHVENCSLTSVEVRSSRLGGGRKIVAVILSYTHRQTDVTEKWSVRVDVTEEFPFLVTKMSPYFDR